ncbi:serine carboxypeptidase S28 [Ancylostoma caninum]|uniref:Serine carboxypeptidase S28 n=1 Tax=Ancylostoma caninum TaxID=29170 RepID=A0A368GM84_ANCCA|nr:serine carboxypeptidase S28 [Ancylostoma caninum]
MTRRNEDPLAKLQAVNVYMAQLYGDFKYTDNSYDDMIKYLRREEFDGENFDSGARSWTWQTCTEFGYYQTTDGGPKGIFGDVTPLSVFVNMCTDVFGKKFDANYIDAAVRATQAHYGGAEDFEATNVVIPNGSVDPWHRLGKLISHYASVVTYLINGTAHCAEMSPPGPNDKPGLKEVRKIIQRNIEKWLTEPRSQSTATTNKRPMMPKARTIYPKQEEETAAKPVLLSQMKFPPWTRHRRMYFGRPPQGFVDPPKINYAAEHILAAETHFITQPFDHFNSQDKRTFKQKYYKNSEWAKPNGPVFLYIGGESPLSSAWVKGFGMFHQTLAEKLGATVFALEHRYYGDSVVGGTAKDPNPDLTYLSSLQMLYDVANFIRTMNAKMNKTPKWITFGGSYADGMMEFNDGNSIIELASIVQHDDGEKWAIAGGELRSGHRDSRIQVNM